jgi:hypothetical protein
MTEGKVSKVHGDVDSLDNQLGSELLFNHRQDVFVVQRRNVHGVRERNRGRSNGDKKSGQE